MIRWSTDCPKFGVETTEYCVSWSILYAEERLKSKMDRSYLSRNLLKEIVYKYHLDDRATSIEKWIKERVDEIFEDMDAFCKKRFLRKHAFCKKRFLRKHAFRGSRNNCFVSKCLKRLKFLENEPKQSV
jgi:hypothetical protein